MPGPPTAPDRKPTDVLTGPERNALRQRLVDVHGLTAGQAAAIANANTRADIVTKMIETCRAFPKA